MAATYTKTFLFKTSVGLVLWILSGGPAAAQIAFTSNAHLKAETKRSRREAAKIETDYKESHLNTHRFTFKKGRSGRKQVRAKEERTGYQPGSNDGYAEPVEFTFKRKARRKSKP